MRCQWLQTKCFVWLHMHIWWNIIKRSWTGTWLLTGNDQPIVIAFRITVYIYHNQENKYSDLNRYLDNEFLYICNQKVSHIHHLHLYTKRHHCLTSHADTCNTRLSNRTFIHISQHGQVDFFNISKCLVCFVSLFMNEVVVRTSCCPSQ